MKAMLTIASIAALLAMSPLSAQTVGSTVLDGGSVVTDLGYNIRVNSGSTLRRSWVVLNDSASPIQLDGVGVSTSYADRSYSYQPTGKAVANAGVAALEIRVLLFDTFGRHMRTLSGTEVSDLATGAELALPDIGSWRASENEVARFLTSVAFVALVRTADGRVWRYNEGAISDQLARIQLQVSSGVLEPTSDD